MFHGEPFGLTVRRCPHGTYHPDPDDVRWAERVVEAHRAECDGCCTTPPP